MIQNTVNAVSLGSTASKRISKNGTVGYIHSIFEKTFFVITENNELIFIVKNGLSNGPINIMIDLEGRQNISFMHIKKNDIVMRQNNFLHIGQSLKINLDRVEMWQPTNNIIKVDDITNIRKKIDYVKKLAIEKGSHYGLGQLIKYDNEIILGKEIPNSSLNIIATKALPHLEEIVTGILHNNLKMVEKNAESIIGLGLGLTPSADDTLSGIMAGLYILGNHFLMDMHQLLAINNSVISKLDETKTTLVSKEFLEHAARGEIAENGRNIIYAILSPSNTLLKPKVEALLKMGETSGTDITLGTILGLRVGLELFEINHSRELK